MLCVLLNDDVWLVHHITSQLWHITLPQLSQVKQHFAAMRIYHPSLYGARGDDASTMMVE